VEPKHGSEQQRKHSHGPIGGDEALVVMALGNRRGTTRWLHGEERRHWTTQMGNAS